MLTHLLLLIAIAFAYAEAEDELRGRNVLAEQRQLGGAPQYPFDLQYEFTLLEPQLQYPPYGGGAARVQPQVLYYPGGASGQPFLLQPGAPPGNFLIPQPHPGVILRDAQPRPPVFVSGYPKPAHVPPINKDAEEIPTNPGAIRPLQPQAGRKPEKLETFDVPEAPAGEAEVLASPGRNPSLKPGHRFFILNGQPLFSSYPLNNFGNSAPFQPNPEQRFVDPDFLLYRQNSYVPNDLDKVQINELPAYKVPTGRHPNRPEEEDYAQKLLGNSLPLPLQKQVPIGFLVKAQPSNSEKLRRPIEVPDEESVPVYEGNVRPGIAQLDYFRYRPSADDDNKESVVIEAKSEEEEDKQAASSDVADDAHSNDKYEEPSISQAQPGAVALAGPGGVAAASPRGTALVGDKGLAVSSPQATAIAGPTRDQIEDKPIKTKKEKQ